MNTKYLFYIILLVVFAGSLLGVYLLARRPVKQSYHYSHTVLPVRTTIIRESVPAEIETLLVDNVPHEIARYKETLTKDKTTVDLDIKYDEFTNLFDIKSDITTLKDSVHVSQPTSLTTRWLRPTLFIGTEFTGKDGINPESTILDVGISIKQKYRLTAFASTKKTYGLRLGVDF